MKRILLALLVVGVMLMPSGAVMASTVTGALYKIVITIGNVGTAATYVSTNCSISTPNLIAGGYANSGATNIALQSSTGADVPFMPGYSTNPMCIFVPSIGASSYLQDQLYLANSSGGKIRFFPDPAAVGLTITDNASLELGNNYDIIIDGFFNTAANNYVLVKNNLFISTTETAIRVQRTGAGAVDISYTVAPGEYAFRLTNDTVNINMYVDASGSYPTTLRATAADAVGLIEAADDWAIASAGPVAIPYISYVQFNKPASTHLTYWDWEYGATFTDNVSAVVATPTFRTTTSDADVTATAGDFIIMDPAEASASALGDPSDWYAFGGLPSATFSTSSVTPTFPGSAIISAIATSTSTPPSIPFTLIGGVVILIASLALSRLIRLGGSGSLILKTVIIAGLMGVLVVTAIWDIWMVFMFLIYAGAIMMASQQRGWA